MWWHTQKPDFVFRRNGRVHLNRRGRQFSRLLAAEACASAVVMLDMPCSEVVWRVLTTHSICQFPLHFPLSCVTVCHHISTGLCHIWLYSATLKQYSFYAYDQFIPEGGFVKEQSVSFSAGAHLLTILPLNIALVPWVYRVRYCG